VARDLGGCVVLERLELSEITGRKGLGDVKPHLDAPHSAQATGVRFVELQFMNPNHILRYI
jgi:hypothetical protein